MGLEIDVLADIVYDNSWLRRNRRGKMETPKIKLVVVEPKGTDLLKEPGLSPKPEDRKDNIILKIRSVTELTFESDDIRILDGHEWAFVGCESGGKQELGWVFGDHVRPENIPISEGMGPYGVSASGGTDVRMEPNLNPHTQEETENIIIRLPVGTQVIVISKVSGTTDGHAWGLAMYTMEDKISFGWVVLDDLTSIHHDIPLPGNSPSGSVSSSYTFFYDGSTRTISEKNLQSAVGGKLSTMQLTDSQVQIELNKPFNNQTKYWASRENLKNITLDPPIK